MSIFTEREDLFSFYDIMMLILLFIVFQLGSCSISTPSCSNGIYLMLGNDCIANGKWFKDSDLQIANGQDGYLHCVLPGGTLNGGQWVKPDGEPVDCTTSGINENNEPGTQDPAWKNPFFCTNNSPSANITLFLDNDDYFKPTKAIKTSSDSPNTVLNTHFIETEYKCCLPTDCSEPNTNIMTINVFERVYIIDVYVDLPPDITAIPQTYTAHCIVTGEFNTDTTITRYYNDFDIQLTRTEYCDGGDHNGYSCTLTNTPVTTYNTHSDTRDYTVIVEWEGKNVSNGGVFTQSVNNGDHRHICTAASGAIKPEYPGRTQSITVKAPSSSPSNLDIVSVSLTSITISWTYPNISDVDGYIVNASSINDYTVVNTASNQTTLDGLVPGSNYTITVRAYQDILGPPSEEIMVTTKNDSILIDISTVLMSKVVSSSIIIDSIPSVDQSFLLISETVPLTMADTIVPIAAESLITLPSTFKQYSATSVILDSSSSSATGILPSSSPFDSFTTVPLLLTSFNTIVSAAPTITVDLSPDTQLIMMSPPPSTIILYSTQSSEVPSPSVTQTVAVDLSLKSQLNIASPPLLTTMLFSAASGSPSTVVLSITPTSTVTMEPSLDEPFSYMEISSSTAISRPVTASIPSSVPLPLVSTSPATGTGMESSAQVTISSVSGILSPLPSLNLDSLTLVSFSNSSTTNSTTTITTSSTSSSMIHSTPHTIMSIQHSSIRYRETTYSRPVSKARSATVVASTHNSAKDMLTEYLSTASTIAVPPGTSSGSSAVVSGIVSGLVVTVVILGIILFISIGVVLKRRSKNQFKFNSEFKFIEKGSRIELMASDPVSSFRKEKSNGSLVRHTSIESSLQKISTNKQDNLDEINAPIPDADHMYEVIDEDQHCVHYENIGSHHVYKKMADEAPPTYDPQIPATKPIQVNDLPSCVLRLTQVELECEEQFSELYKGEDKSCSIGSDKKNKMFNRFKNIIPYDDNLIKLRPIPSHEEYNREYVNASYIDGYSQKQRYIASQGPNENTVVDFWRLVWQEDVPVIIMLTNLVESAKVKCEKYWPRQGEREEPIETYGPFTVTVTDKQIQPNSVIRTMLIKLSFSDSCGKCVKHFHFTKWPDHGVPDSASPLMKFHNMIKKNLAVGSADQQQQLSGHGPIIVHCSAGVGRTGTFIAVDMALEQAEKEGMVDIAGIVTRLRQQRMKMVQNQGQYMFVYQVVMESVVCGNTSIPCHQFASSLVNLYSHHDKGGVTRIHKQYKSLDIVTSSKHSFVTAMENMDKNRTENNLPSDKHRVVLKDVALNYINAVFIQGYMESRPYILAQSPMENTAIDFWRMIHNYNVTAIVMCCREDEKCCYPYWLTHEQLGFCVKAMNTSSESGVTITNLEGTILVEIDADNLTCEVTQFCITDWAESGKLVNICSLLKVIEKVIKVRQNTRGGRIVVHCSDSVSRSGVYCAVSNAIEQCKAEGEIDIFQVVKNIRMNKPGAIPTLDHYVLIHKVVAGYLDDINLYDNFRQ